VAQVGGGRERASPPEAIEELMDAFNKSFGYWSDRSYESGDIARWVANAEALAHVKVNGVLQDWPLRLLGRNLVEAIEFDNGPHSVTRVQFRARLLADARGSNATKRDDAIRILKCIKEQGALMALSEAPGPTGAIARKALFEVVHPKVTTHRLPDSPRGR
jgi:hypothetical protein